MEPLLYGQVNVRWDVRYDSPSAYVGCLRGNNRISTAGSQINLHETAIGGEVEVMANGRYPSSSYQTNYGGMA